MNVVVIGGGVAGLATALHLGRAGHDVTVIERDDTPMPATADEAFEWNRRGAPQVRHSHAFLARLRNLLRDHQPDILEALLAEGATEMRFGDGVPPEMEFAPEPGDDDLVMIACRRTTFEWVLRRAALAEANVTIRTGVAAIGLIDTDHENAAAIAEALRKSFEDDPRLLHLCTSPVTASFGVVTARAGDTMDTLLTRVDSAMYRAKELGKTRLEAR